MSPSSSAATARRPVVPNQSRRYAAELRAAEQRSATLSRLGAVSGEPCPADRREGHAFWAALDRGSLRGRPVSTIAADERARLLRARLREHPFGRRVTGGDLVVLRRWFARARGEVDRTADRSEWDVIRPVGMSPDRALEIALEVLDRHPQRLRDWGAAPRTRRPARD